MKEGGPIKHEMPKINKETGMTADYINEIGYLCTFFEQGEKGEIIKALIKNGVRKYQDRYPESEYNNVITEKNKLAVERLNELADRMNQFAKDEDFNLSEFASTYNEMTFLIFGSETRKNIDTKDFGKWKLD